MRLRKLELLKYGVFANQAFDFGDGQVDLHLIVGPNEAGKSTLLNGISDLLFGIPERTSYGFRHGMSELAIAGVLEQGAERLAMVRRKKRKDPLTTPDGQPMAERLLDPLLGGTDREAFAKMFGLNQTRLREGGDSFLQGAHNAARAVLEAEGGLTGLGVLLAELDAQADAIFAPSARTKPLNIKLAERKAAEQRARDEAVDERQWAALNARQTAAETARQGLIARLAEIAGSLAGLERIRRVRPLLASLDSRLEDLAPLAALPHLPPDAEARRSQAERQLTAGDARLQTLEESLARAQAPAGEDRIDPRLVEQAEAIERLLAGRGVYEDRRRALPRRAEDLARLAAGIESLKADGGLGALGDPPRKIDRDRLRAAVTTARDGRATHGQLRETHDGLLRNLETETQRLAGISAVGDLPGLRERLEQAPRDVSRQREAARKAIEGAARKLALETAGLAPWTGEMAALAAVAPPAEVVIEAARSRLASLDAEAAEHRRALADAEARLADSQAELARLSGDGAPLPTRAAVADARQARDSAWAQLRDGAQAPAGEGFRATPDAVHYEALVRQADDLADRRQSEADRLAAHLMHSAEAERLTSRALAAKAGLVRLAEVRAGEDLAWNVHCLRAGFSAAIRPAAMSAWAAARLRVLEAYDALVACRTEADASSARTDRQLLTLRDALAATDPTIGPDADADALIAQATALVRHLEARQLERTSIQELVARLDADARRSTEVLGAEGARAEARARNLAEALVGCGLDPASDDTAVTGALEAFDQWVSAVTAHDQMRQRVRDIQAEITDFESEVAELLKRLDAPIAVDAGQAVQALGDALRETRAVQTRAERAVEEAAGIAQDIANLRDTLQAARADLAELAGLASVTDPAALADVIAMARRRDDLQAEADRLRLEIGVAGDGLAIDTLRHDVGVIAPEALAAEISVLTAERFDLGEQRDAVSTELAEAARDVTLHASGSGAAEALQEAENARAEASTHAERYVEARSVAALLRWAIDRHRKTRAAPLLARASAIMATITAGAFVGLELDFEQGDEPIVVGLRSSGERLASLAMSEGTRDQLYLSLRLAAVEERAMRHAMPFIADDLLVNGDDDRCAAIFGALGRLSQTSQVLCFTHHEHLVPIAERALGADGFRLHRMVKRPLEAAVL